MNRCLLFGILVIGLWLALRPGVQNQVVSAGGLGCSNSSFPFCADVNGDGNLDVSDPVYLLVWLFANGAEPKCCAATAQGPADWVMNQAVPIAGRRSEGRFKDNGDGTVIDLLTGLQWQQRTGDWNRDGVIDGQDKITYADAKIYTRSLNLGGKADWRLPNPREMQSIVDRTVFNPAIDPIFADTKVNGDGYWVDDGTEARALDFYFGDLPSGYGGGTLYVRLVRTP